MSTMGSHCSAQRRSIHRRQALEWHDAAEGGSRTRRSLKHSVVCAIPDGSIAALYPVEDNYVNENNKRSPKTLADLCVDTLCRNLPYFEGELPAHLPKDVVDDVVNSLQEHSALNATTLRLLRNCEIATLNLAGCRGVTDEWFEPLAGCTSSFSESSNVELVDESAATPRDIFYGDFDEHDEASDTSFASTYSQHMEVEQPEYKHHMFASVTTTLAHLDLRGSQSLSDRGLLKLTNLGCLLTAKLDDCHSLTGRGLLAFANSLQLRTLSLANCRRLTDEGILNVSHLTSIVELNLEGCRCITDQSLAAIVDFTEMRKLDLSQCDLITNTGLSNLSYMEDLEELSVGWCPALSDEDLKTLADHPNRSNRLLVLRLARCGITDEGLESLAKLSSLEELDLNGCSNLTSSALGQAIGKLKNLTVLDVSYCPRILRSGWQGKIENLRSLDLCYSGVKNAHLNRLLHLPRLEELNLDSCPVGDLAISHLADHDVLPNLLSLDLADSNLSDHGMRKLTKFTKLKKLSLFYCNISNIGLQHLASLTDLEELNLDSREISDEGLVFLQHLTKLKALDIFSGRITETGCVHIAKATSLESLELCGGGIGDMGCYWLAGLENLTSLNLSQNDLITNRGATALATLSKLKALNLSHTRVNSNALKFFSGLKHLQSLALYGCRDVENEVSDLQTGLPNLKCLRINSARDEDGMMIAVDDDEYDNWAVGADVNMDDSSVSTASD